MGRGISRDAMKAILERGLNVLHLQRIYWCVSPLNRRAVRFYDKNGYEKWNPPTQVPGYTDEQKRQYIWYAVEAF